MAQGLDGQEIDAVNERFAGELGIVERGRGTHRINHYQGRLLGVDAIGRKPVAGRDAAQVGDFDRLLCCHGLGDCRVKGQKDGGSSVEFRSLVAESVCGETAEVDIDKGSVPSSEEDVRSGLEICPRPNPYFSIISRWALGLVTTWRLTCSPH